MKEFIIIISTFPTKDDAERISEIILNKKLASCVQIIGPILSQYWWQGTLEKKEEYSIHIKTVDKLFNDIENEIKINHPYTVPEIICIPIINGSEDYLSWIANESKGYNL